MQIVNLPRGAFALHGVPCELENVTLHAWCDHTGRVLVARALDQRGSESSLSPRGSVWRARLEQLARDVVRERAQ